MKERKNLDYDVENRLMKESSNQYIKFGLQMERKPWTIISESNCSIAHYFRTLSMFLSLSFSTFQYYIKKLIATQYYNYVIS